MGPGRAQPEKVTWAHPPAGGVPGRPILSYQDWQSGMDKNNTIMNSG